MSKRRWLDLAVVLAAVVTGGVMSAQPWRIASQEGKKTAADRNALREAESEVNDLTNRRQRLESQVGREERAREMGYIRPDERPLDR